MPSPPRKGESQQDFISRCISYLRKREGKSADQAAGQCYGMWRSRNSKKRKAIKQRRKSKK